MLLSLSMLSACGSSGGEQTPPDTIDGSLTVVINGSVTINMISNNTIAYTATDAAGNSSSIERTVNVADLTGPGHITWKYLSCLNYHLYKL